MIDRLSFIIVRCHMYQHVQNDTGLFTIVLNLINSHAFSTILLWLSMLCFERVWGKTWSKKKKTLHDLLCFNVIIARRRLSFFHINYLLSFAFIKFRKMIINNMIFIFDRFSCSIVLATSCSDRSSNVIRWKAEKCNSARRNLSLSDIAHHVDRNEQICSINNLIDLS